MAELQKAVGARIRELRMARGWSQESYADICEIHRSHMGEIERGVATFVRGPNHGLIVTSQLAQAERERIIALAAQYRLPAVYPYRFFTEVGGQRSC